MKNLHSTVILLLLTIFSGGLFAQTFVEGNVSGVWERPGSPYIATEAISLNDGDTLIIEPGVEVLFRVEFPFYVRGLLQAIGAEGDSIYFRPESEEEDASWGGMRLIEADSLTHISYCVFLNGRALQDGDQFIPEATGANLFITGEDILVESSRFSGGYARSTGGGIGIWAGSPTISECLISGNGSNYGGGIGIYAQSSPNIENCRIEGNLVQRNRNPAGGGMFICLESHPIVSNCMFFGNVSNGENRWDYNITGGGGLYIGFESNPEFSDCQFVENVSMGASGDGGALAIRAASSPEFTNCIFDQNESRDSGGGLYIRDQGTNPLFEYCVFSRNTITDGDMDGGGVYIRAGSGCEIRYSQFINNVSDWGGALGVKEPPACNIHHNLFINNGCRLGGSAISTDDDLGENPLVIQSCTFVNQRYTGLNPVPLTARPRGDSRVVISNSIIWDPNPHFPDENVFVNYSQVFDGYDGEGNSDLDPLFFELDSTNYSLSGNSPCIDTGHPDLPADPDGSPADRGWLYFPGNAFEGLQVDSLAVELEYMGSDTLRLSYINNTGVPIYITPLDRAEEGDPLAFINVTAYTGDSDINGITATKNGCFVSGGNNGQEGNNVYYFEDFNFMNQFAQPGDPNGVGFLDITSDGENVIFGAESNRAYEFTTEGEPGDPYDIRYNADPPIEYVKAITAIFEENGANCDFYLTGDEGFIVCADGDMWERGRMEIGERIYSMASRKNTNAIYIVTQPVEGEFLLSLLQLDDGSIFPLYNINTLDGYSLSSIDITHDMINGKAHLLGVLQGDNDGNDMIFFEELYTSWMVVKPEVKRVLPGEEVFWNIGFAGNEVEPGDYMSSIAISINGGGVRNTIPTYMTVLPEPVDTNAVSLDHPEFPKDLVLSSVFPNPFNDRARFTYSIREAGWLNISLIDQRGRQVRLLQDGHKTTGDYQGWINAHSIPSGEYFLRLALNNKKVTKTVIILK
ncbi:MAG: T9SS type A sorting domain-containing protein [Calditrichaeota bacterium]|nr:T9SS type A sorting domain-containing protein [Calditrichota bacterium]